MPPGTRYFLEVNPRIPKRLARLEGLAQNLWYSWDRPTRALFAKLNPASLMRNPVIFVVEVVSAVVTIRIVADAVSGEFRRIQCTPDLLPSDIVGTQIYDAAKGSFHTQLGPVHANIVLLDEINIVLKYGYLPLAEVVGFLRDEKPADKHVVITGRHAAPELVEIADLVTEMTPVKHPFRQGIKAQKGIEF